MQMRRFYEPVFEFFFRVAAAFLAVTLLLIIYVMLREGLPAFYKVGFRPFIFGIEWQPSAGVFGILPMIVASLAVTFGSILLGYPVGLLVAIYISEMAKPKMRKILRSLVNLMAAIPSVVYGFWGLAVIVPRIRAVALPGNSLLAAIIVVSIMVLPTIISVGVSALQSVPYDEKAASLALGESSTFTTWRMSIPRCKSTLQAGLVLAFGRAIGEATAVALVAGNTVQMPGSVFDSVRTLTANTILEMGYASGLHREALMATGLVLFAFILVVNIGLTLLNRQGLK